MTNTWYMSFGNLKIGEKFYFCNPWAKNLARSSEVFVKVSPRKYRKLVADCAITSGLTWQTSAKSGVAIVRDEK
jgi:hypothetical protein